MIPSEDLNLLVWPTPLLALLAGIAWYFVIIPETRFARQRKYSRRNRKILRWMWLVMALCLTIVIAAFFFRLIAG